MHRGHALAEGGAACVLVVEPWCGEMPPRRPCASRCFSCCHTSLVPASLDSPGLGSSFATTLGTYSATRCSSDGSSMNASSGGCGAPPGCALICVPWAGAANGTAAPAARGSSRRCVGLVSSGDPG